MSDKTGAAGRGEEDERLGRVLHAYLVPTEVVDEPFEHYRNLMTGAARVVAAAAVEAERARGAALREALRAYLDDPTFPPLPSQNMRLDAAGKAYDGEADKAAAVLACADEWEKDGR